MKTLTEKKKELLREFVNHKCESCGRSEKELGKKLTIHRIQRGHKGGEYKLNNIQVLCSECHKMRHWREF